MTGLGAMRDPLAELSLEQLRRRTSRKWQTFSPDVLPLWIAELDVRLAPAVADAVHDAIRTGDTGYTAGTAFPEAARGFAAARWGWDFDVEGTSSVPDVMRGMTEIVRLLTEPGDRVIVTPPIYPPFYGFSRSAQRAVVEAPLTAAGRLNLETLDTAFQAATQGGRRAVFLLCNPHNPTGAVHTREELSRVAVLAAEHKVRVISDEIHGPLVLPGASFVPYLTVPGTENAFALISASKGWNLAGLKAALAIAGSDAVDDRYRLPVEVPLGASHLGVIAQTAAFRDGGAWLDDLISSLDRNRTLLTDLIRTELCGIEFSPPQATFLAWLDCRRLYEQTCPVSAADFFLDQARVALNPGAPFGAGDGFVRLNFGTNPAILRDAIHLMSAALAGGAAARQASPGQAAASNLRTTCA